MDPTRKLCQAFASLLDPQDCRKFLTDLCTPAELKAMGHRLEVAKLVDRGIPYREIAKRTGASTATITRIARCLSDGPGGYRRVIDNEGRV